MVHVSKGLGLCDSSQVVDTELKAELLQVLKMKRAGWSMLRSTTESAFTGRGITSEKGPNQRDREDSGCVTWCELTRASYLTAAESRVMAFSSEMPLLMVS